MEGQTAQQSLADTAATPANPESRAVEPRPGSASSHADGASSNGEALDATAELENINLTDEINRMAAAPDTQIRAPKMAWADLPSMARDPLEAALLGLADCFQKQVDRGLTPLEPRPGIQRELDSLNTVLPYMDHVHEILEHFRKHRSYGRQEVIVSGQSVSSVQPAAKPPKAKRVKKTFDEQVMADLNQYPWRKDPWPYLRTMAQDPVEEMLLLNIKTMGGYVQRCFACTPAYPCGGQHLYLMETVKLSKCLLKIADQFRKARVQGRQHITVRHETMVEPAPRRRRRGGNVQQARYPNAVSGMKDVAG